jgi:glutathione reductase (NADPH)
MFPSGATERGDMANYSYDVVIIGGGNGGMGVTGPTRNAGKTVAMIEPAEFGGTCNNRGCVPKKVLVAAAQSLDAIAGAGSHAISVGPARLDWAAMIEQEKKLIAPISDSLGGSMEKRGVHLVRAHARFVTRNAVRAGGHDYEAEHIVIATGSRPRPLPFPGAELMITSDEVLSERAQPRDVVFVGGGVIAFEFAHVYARAGTKVTILNAGGRLLARYDADVIVFGHTHRPLVVRFGRRLVVNPGSAGPRRFDLMPSVARLTIRHGAAHAEIIDLPV